MYGKGPTAEEAAVWGLTLEEAQGDAVDIWPDNLNSVNVFIAASTQWRTGTAGATGLDYTALEATMRMLSIPRKDRGAVLEDIRVLEDAALDTMRRAKK